MQEDVKVEIIKMAQAGMPPKAIAEEQNLSVSAVRAVLKAAGITVGKKDTTTRDAQVCLEYQDPQIPVTDILVKHNIGYPQLYSILAVAQIPTRTATNAEGREKQLETAIQMYVDGYPIWKIREETGIAQPTLHSELHKKGIVLRRPR